MYNSYLCKIQQSPCFDLVEKPDFRITSDLASSPLLRPCGEASHSYRYQNNKAHTLR